VTGLTPTIDIWRTDTGAQVITAASMTETAAGGYYYNFATYDEDTPYLIRADGGSSLSGNYRYAFASNDSMTEANLDAASDEWPI
jgi:hypothetical protein